MSEFCKVLELNITNIVRKHSPDGLSGHMKTTVRLSINRTVYEQAETIGFFKYRRHLPQQKDAGFASCPGKANSSQGAIRRYVHDALPGTDGLRRRKPNRRRFQRLQLTGCSWNFLCKLHRSLSR